MNWNDRSVDDLSIAASRLVAKLPPDVFILTVPRIGAILDAMIPHLAGAFPWAEFRKRHGAPVGIASPCLTVAISSGAEDGTVQNALESAGYELDDQRYIYGAGYVSPGKAWTHVPCKTDAATKSTNRRPVGAFGGDLTPRRASVARLQLHLLVQISIAVYLPTDVGRFVRRVRQITRHGINAFSAPTRHRREPTQLEMKCGSTTPIARQTGWDYARSGKAGFTFTTCSRNMRIGRQTRYIGGRISPSLNYDTDRADCKFSSPKEDRFGE
jgi:hypothetical protein